MKLHFLAPARGFARHVGRCDRCGFVMWPSSLQEEEQAGSAGRFTVDWDFTSDPEKWIADKFRCSTLDLTEDKQP